MQHKIGIILTAALGLSGCGNEDLKPFDGRDSTRDSADGSVVNTELLAEDVYTVAKSTSAEIVTKDGLFALSLCNCNPRLRNTLLMASLSGRGVLPQVLMPDIRDKIRSNDQLNTLLQLPGAIQDLAKFLFANDSKIESQVRAGLIETISPFISKADRVLMEGSLRFDGFSSFADNTTDLHAASQALKWLLSVRSAAQDDAKQSGIAFVSIMKLFAEWKYAFGLDQDDGGRAIGGLTVDAKAPKNPTLMAFDPRENAEEPRILTGSYKVSYPDASALESALETKEQWQRTQIDGYELSEQALLWLAGARVFERVSEQERAAWLDRGFQGAEALFPADAHLLGLAYLPGLKAGLTGDFIDAESRTIYATSMREGAPRKADTRELTLLLYALSAWYRAITEVGNAATIDHALRADLRGALPELQRAMQLVTQTLLIELNDWYGSGIEASLRTLALTLGAVIEAETVALASDFLKKRTGIFYQALIERHLHSVALSNSNVNAVDLWAVLTCAQKFEARQPDVMPWNAGIISGITTGLSKWDEQFNVGK